MRLAANDKDSALIRQIAERAQAMGYKRPLLNQLIDITACHLNGCRLDLKGLLGASELDFAHDLLGIERHLDRDTGKLRNLFEPRCRAKRKARAHA